MSDPMSFVGGFTAGFGVVDTAIARRRHAADQERRTALAERVTLRSEQQQRFNNELTMTEEARRKTDFENTQTDRTRMLAERNAAVVGKQVHGFLQQNNYNVDALRDEDILGMYNANPDYSDGGRTRFTGIAPDGTLLVSGQRKDGTRFENIPATEGGVPVDQGGVPISFGSRRGAAEHAIASLAPFSPEASNALGAERTKQRDRQEQRNALGALAAQVEGQGYGATGQQGDPAPRSQVTQETGRAAGQPRLDNPFEPGVGDAKTMKAGDLNSGLPGDMRIPGGSNREFNVPKWMMSANDMVEAGMDSRAQALQTEKQAQWFRDQGGDATGLPGSGGFPVAKAASDRVTARQEAAKSAPERWNAINNAGDPTGHTGRLQAAENPQAFLETYRRDRHALSQVERQASDMTVYPVLRDRQDSLVAEMNERFGAEGGETLWRLDTPEAQAMHKELTQSFAMERSIRDDYKAAKIAAITGETMPVGNAELNARIMAAVQNRPIAHEPVTHDRLRPAVAVLDNHIRREGQVAGQRRKISTPLINAIPVLMEARMLNEESLANLLETGSMTRPNYQYVAGGGVYQETPDGGLITIIDPVPTLLAKSQADLAKEQLAAIAAGRKAVGDNYAMLDSMVRNRFKHEGSEALEGRVFDLMLQIGRGGTDFANRYGYGPADMANMTPSDLAQLVDRHDEFRSARNEVTSSFWQSSKGPAGMRGSITPGQRERAFDENYTIANFPGGDRGTQMPVTTGERLGVFDNDPAFQAQVDEIRGQLMLMPDLDLDPNVVDEMDDEDVFRLWERLKDERQTTRRPN